MYYNFVTAKDLMEAAESRGVLGHRGITNQHTPAVEDNLKEKGKKL